MNTLLSFVLISLCGISHALHLPVVARSPMPMKSAMRMQQVSVADQNVENARDVVYATNITLGGQEFPIQLDTGSSDVWVQTPFPLTFTNTTNIPANLTFGIGQVSGNIEFADMSFGPYTVRSQAILNATTATDFDAIFSNNIFGIMGLSFDIGSTVFIETLEAFGANSTQGLTFMSNIFRQNKTAPNLFTVLLGRSYDKDGPEEGAFTISEYVTGFEGVSTQPQLFRTPAQTVNITDVPRWSVQMDSMTVNGKQFAFNKTVVSEADPGKQVVVLDTGFTFSQIPPAAVDFIYSSIPGAEFNQTSGLWVVPCENTTTLSFEFGGKSIPIHPLDITTVTTNGDQTICTNAYRAINLPPGATSGFDFILGDSFLKNVYASFDYGDFTPDNRTAGVPFVQILPTTDPAVATSEFATVRASQVQKNDAAIAAATGKPVAAGSLRLFGREQHQPMHGRVRVIFKTGHAHPVMMQKAMDCMNQVADTYGPVALALLAGTFAILLIFGFACVFIGIYTLVASRRNDEGYEPLELKEDTLFDADQIDQDHPSLYYPHDITTPPAYVGK